MSDTEPTTDHVDETDVIMGRVISKQLRDHAEALAILQRMERAAVCPWDLDSSPVDFEELDPDEAAHCMRFWDAATHYLSLQGVRDPALKATLRHIWAHFPGAPLDQWALQGDDQVPHHIDDLLELWDHAGAMFDPDSATVLPVRLSVDVDFVVSPMTTDRSFARAIADSAFVRTPENGDDDGNFIIEIYVPWHLPLNRGGRRAFDMTVSETVKATRRRPGPSK